MRILVVGPVPPPHHGVAVMTRTLLDSALSARFDIVHLDTSDRRGVQNIGRIDAGNVWLAAVHGVHFVKLLMCNAVDIVYVPVSQNSPGFLRDSLFLIPAMLRRVPIVLHLHGGRYDAFVRLAPAPVRALARFVFRRAASIIVLGESLKGMLDELAAASRIHVVPNGVSDPRDRMDAVNDDVGAGMRILFLGNLIPTKGYVELLTAVQMLLDEGLDVAVTFAGGVADDGAHRRALSLLRYGPDRIRFVGSVDAAAKAVLLRSADVLALPSYYENEAHPLVILEAMAAGLPVVSTRHAAIPETVVDGQTGVLVEQRDVAGLAAALRRLAEQPELRRAMGRAARQRYADGFTVARWTHDMAAVFDNVAARV